MRRYDLIVVGAGPAGLSAACEAAAAGLDVVVFDENERPGGQLFKQIHKFFGSREHSAGVRGVSIGEGLLARAQGLGAKAALGATVLGIYKHKEVAVRTEGEVRNYKADAIVIAAGAAENTMAFDGWTKPGVMGAGAAQTLMNLHGIRPGKKILMVGSGNVGLVVSFQLIQAGCEVAAIVDAAERIGGYGVHAAKLARMGVPFLTSHTITKAIGDERVNGAVIAKVDKAFRPIPGTEKRLDVDTVCIAVGLSPMSQLADCAGCDMEYDGAKGGYVPVLSEEGETSIKGIFCAGDVCGIEEASSAMIQGRLAGAAAAFMLGYMGAEEYRQKTKQGGRSLEKIRAGMFGPGNKGRTGVTATDEGCPLSRSLLKKGFVADGEAKDYHTFAYGGGVRPVIECTQNIPCDPCQDVCPKGCIVVGKTITALPRLAAEAQCSGCGLCVAACPGQAVFLVNDAGEDGCGTVALPYELLPLPEKGAAGMALSRSGEALCEASVVEVRSSAAMGKTPMLVMKVPKDMLGRARFFRPSEESAVCGERSAK